ncbi:MAG: hypothetical protein Q7R95_04735 [bacterium]|nr:hypothetical protein [bacterium]
MPNHKSIGAIIFYIFIIIFIVLAYLNNNGTLSSFFPKTTTAPKKNIIQIEYKDKEYNADYIKKFSGAALEIASFEEGEKWIGDYKIDDVNYWEGQDSYVVLAKGLAPNILTLRKSMNLADSTVIKILVYSVNQENTDNIKKAALRLGNLADSAYYEYEIRNIKPGWNIIQMPKSNFSFINGPVSTKEEGTTDTKSEKSNVGSDRLWANIEKVSFELDSRPNTQVELSFDRLWAEKGDGYKKEFLTSDFNMLSPQVWNGKSYINVWALGGTLSLINKVSGVKNFTYTAKIIPQKTGTFGINARTDITTTYGYYLSIGGIGTGSWRLNKIGKIVNDSSVTELDSGGIANFQLEANQPVWLRLSTSGNAIAGYLSIDGKNFTKLTEKNDSEHTSGGIGVQTAASYLLESVEFKQ